MQNTKSVYKTLVIDCCLPENLHEISSEAILLISQGFFMGFNELLLLIGPQVRYFNMHGSLLISSHNCLMKEVLESLF